MLEPRGSGNIFVSHPAFSRRNRSIGVNKILFSHLDKILVQKAACPVAGRSDLHGTAEVMSKAQPNAVVLEKSSHDEADINAQRFAALRQFAERLDSPKVAEMNPARKKSRGAAVEAPRGGDNVQQNGSPNIDAAAVPRS